MSTRDAGLPGIAIVFWKGYAREWSTLAFVGLLAGGTLLAVASIQGAQRVPYLWIALLGFSIYGSAYMFRDSLARQLEADEDENTLTYEDVFSIAVLVASYIDTVLIVGAALGMAVASIGDPAAGLLTALVVPGVDLFLLRRTGYSVGGVALTIAYYVLRAAGAVREVVMDTLPVIGRRQRPGQAS